MDFFTHLIIAAIISVITLNSLPLSLLIYACFMAFLADFDIILEPLRKVFKTNLLAHKGISHSIFYSALISALTGLIFTMITGISFLITWLVGSLFYDLHIFLDFLTASKIPLFYPITKKRFRFFIDRAINFYLAIISASIMIFSILSFFFWQSIFALNLLFYITGFYILYFTFRIIIKVRVSSKNPNNNFIPGLSPFEYMLYTKTISKDNMHFILSSKNILTRNQRVLFNSGIKEINSSWELYHKLVNLAAQFPFGEKWQYFIPIFNLNNENIIINLIFAESYFKGSYYNIKIKFDKIFNNVLEIHEGFKRKGITL